ncbi:MAG: dienelactone hydrolase family protein [Proteobacteria bacterium]|nr:dienelactone hydrolase family protein [Pseudomonadota bacterium]
MAGKMKTIPAPGGGKFRAYVSTPRGGKGPGLIVLQEIFGLNANMREVADQFAEEGYVAVVPDLYWRIKPGIALGFSDAELAKAFEDLGQFDVDKAIKDVAATLKVMRGMKSVSGGVGAVGFCLGGRLAYLTAARTKIDCAVGYYGVGIEKLLKEVKNIKCPLLLHFGAADKYVPVSAVEKIRAALRRRDDVEIYVYPDRDHAFMNRAWPGYHKPTAMMAYSRTLAFLRRALGPKYDLSALWEKHTMYEFGARDVAATMATMVAAPYVNHIPTMTGGVGAKQLARFYKHAFIPKCPADTKLVPISRTIGADRVVDEMLFCFTHDVEIDWMLPGLRPTGKYVEIPLVAIVNFRGDRLYHEHIYWDQASVLVQIGVLDPKGLPMAGVETAKKLIDETRPSNALMHRWAESEGLPV